MTDTLTAHDVEQGKLCEGWLLSTIGEQCEVVAGSTPKSAVGEYWGGDIAWLTPKDLSQDRSQFVEHGERSITKSGYESCSTRLVPAGSVLFTSRAPIGYVAIAANEMCTNQGFKTAVPGSGLQSEFLYWQLQHVTPDIRSRASGTTFPEISGKGFAATEIVVPQLEEQERIVEILEDQLSRLDTALESIQVVREKAAQFRHSLLHAAFTGVLTGHGEESWPRTSLNEAVDDKADIVDGPFGSNLKTAHYVPEGARVIRLQNIGYGQFVPADAFITLEHYERLAKHNVVKGDLLFASLGENLPRTCLAPAFEQPAIVKADCIRVRLSTAVNPRFVLFATQTPEAQKWASEQLHGMGRPRLGLGAIRDFSFPLPSRRIQDEVVEVLEDQLSRLDASLAVADAVEERSAALRRSLLHSAFTGRLTEEWREAVNV